MKVIKKIWALLGILITIYLLIPSASFPPIDLPNSFKSDEPGDTWQIENVSAYYTEKDRGEVISFYQNYFTKPTIFPPIRLNYPPEFGKEVFIDTKQTYYLEELVYPLKQSLFVNGYEWQNDVFTPVASREQFKLEADGKVWKSKVSLKWFASSLPTRLVIFWSGWLVFLTSISLWTRELSQFLLIFKKKK
jgi:hypothetical protein